MTTEENMIPIEPYLKDFKQYLDANSRCILSAKFGNGKSYFISSFIKEYSNDYLFIPIYPVNYQVMDNKDIFELIKRDILIKLLSSEEININEIELNAASLFYYFFTNNQEDKFLDILSIIPDINIYGIDINISYVIKKLKEVKDKFATYKKQFKSDDETYESYITQFDSLKGSIYEFDKTCGDNKFCLDKIVTVCDINNIKKIYAHVYGKETDFIGYISKFSNSKAYDYSLTEKIKEFLINTLLDKDLLKYPQICDSLSDLIVSSMDEKSTVKSNLRIIKERIVNANNLIRSKSINLNQRFAGKYITSDSDFTKLLALLKAFGFSFNNLKIESTFDEFVRIIGKYWILAAIFGRNIIFEPCNNNIKVAYYREIRQGIGDWLQSDPIYNCIDGDQILDFDISNWDAEATVPSYIFDQIHNIVNYLNRVFII